MHHTGHQPRHPQQDVVLRRDEDVERTEVVHQIGEDESRQPTHEERRSEEPSTATTRIGRDGGKDLEEDGQEEEGKDHPIRAREGLEDTAVEELGVLPVQQDIHCIVSFAVEWGEEEDQQGEDDGRYEIAHSVVRYTTELPFEAEHRLREVERHQSAYDSQQDHQGDTLDMVGVGLDELEEDLLPRDDVGYRGSRYRAYQQR